jgi:glycolate oxidase iron-sulfur subunit
MARRNIDAFDGAAFIVTESAGCGAMMKGYGELLSGDPAYAARASGFSSRVRDLSEILVEAGLRPGPSAVRERIVYDAPCHLHHAQKVTEAPVLLLGAVPGAEIVRLENSERCCGGAGLYNLLEPALSWEILGRKMERIRASGAGIVASGNPGCLMQLGAGARFFGVPARILHPAEILEATWVNRSRG